MAEVEQSSDSGHGKKGGPKSKKKSTKVDMTAMVDVAFLLLTFFVLTATMSNNAVISLTLPPKIEEEDPNIDQKYKKMREDKIMTIVLGKKDTIKYYVGAANEETMLENTNYSPSGIRDVLLEHINKGPSQNIPMCKDVNDQGINEGRCWDPIFVVKPRDESRYKNLVDILDEFAITEANKYAIDQFTKADSIFLADHVNPEEEEE